MNKKIVVTIICIILALASIAGVVIAIIPKNNEEAVETEGSNESSADIASDDTDKEGTEDSKSSELTSPPEGHTPIPDLNDGNEIYLDTDVIDKLQQLEDAGMDDEVNLILDTMLLLINEFVDREYSALAICQIQRFYFEFFEEIGDIEFDTLCDKLADCISSNGLDSDEFARNACDKFGLNENTNFSYVYSAEVSS